MTRALLAFASLAGIVLLTLAPTAVADRFLCQPHVTATFCIRIIDSDGWAYFEACDNGPSANICVGGGHWDYSPTPYVGNGLGLEMCSAVFCGGAVVGQEDYFGRFDVYAGAGGSTPAGSALVFGTAGTFAGAPFVDGAACAGTLVVTAPCVLV